MILENYFFLVVNPSSSKTTEQLIEAPENSRKRKRSEPWEGESLQCPQLAQQYFCGCYMCSIAKQGSNSYISFVLFKAAQCRRVDQAAQAHGYYVQALLDEQKPKLNSKIEV